MATETLSECFQCQLPSRFLDRVIARSKLVLERYNDRRGNSFASHRKLVMDSLLLRWKYRLVEAQDDQCFLHLQEGKQTLLVFRESDSRISDVDVELVRQFLSELKEHSGWLYDHEVEVTLVASPGIPRIVVSEDEASGSTNAG